MDTTETYIKMRVKAIPDLGMGIPPQCICGLEWVTDTVFIDEMGNWYYSKEPREWVGEATQLERQDQLQEMVIHFGHGHSNGGILVGLSMFSQEYGYNETSMEQLWLAFVMKEKYSKVWDGKDWVTNGN